MSGPGDKNDQCIGEAVDTQIRAKLTEFIVTNYLFGNTASVPRDDDSLVEEGIIDSTGILELIEFLESHFEVEVSESETVPENLGSISKLTEFVMSKRSRSRADLLNSGVRDGCLQKIGTDHKGVHDPANTIRPFETRFPVINP
jgi:acyl carrier protein